MNFLKGLVVVLVVAGVFGGKYLLGVSFAEEAKKAPAKGAEHKEHHHEEEKEDAHNHAGEKEEHGEEGHDHGGGDEHEEKEGHAHAEGEEEGEGSAHAEGESKHGEEGEEGGVIGPDKGITAKGPNGFTLSKEAWASFELKTQEVDASSLIPKAALVQIKAGKFYYRIREGWIKRVPNTSKFQKGDQVIVVGTGFVRTAELVVEEGVSHGHSH